MKIFPLIFFSFIVVPMISQITINCDNSFIELGNQVTEIETFEKVGHSVSISGDGLTIAVASSEEHTISVLQYKNNNWIPKGLPIHTNELGDTSLGKSIQISDDGTILVVGDYYENTVKVYEFKENDWIQKGNTLFGNENEHYGFDVDISNDGLTIVVGAKNSFDVINGNSTGKTYVYKFSDNYWSQLGTTLIGFVAAGRFGRQVSISGDGLTIAAGASWAGITNYVGIYKFIDGDWIQLGNYILGGTSSGFGSSLDLSNDGSTLIIAAPSANKIEIFEYESDTWQKTNQVINSSSFDYFGTKIEINDTNDIIVIGSRGMTSVYHKNDTNNTWQQFSQNVIWENGTGWTDSVAISNDGLTFVTGDTENGVKVLTYGYCEPNISVDYNENNFGVIYDDEIITKNFTIKNIGTGTLNINSIASSNPNFVIINDLITLNENEEGTFQVQYSNANFNFEENYANITIKTNANNLPEYNFNVNAYVVNSYNSEIIWENSSEILGENEGDQLGNSVSISSNGNVMALAAFANDDNEEDSGYVKIYSINEERYSQLGNTIYGESSFDYFGNKIKLSDEGNTLIVYAKQTEDNFFTTNEFGYIYVYSYNSTGDTWEQKGSKIILNDYFYNVSTPSIDINFDGSHIIVGLPSFYPGFFYNGSVLVYHFNDNDWTLKGQQITAEDNYIFAEDICISGDGSKLVFTEYDLENYSSTISIYDYNNSLNSWQLYQNIEHSNDIILDTKIDLSPDGKKLAVIYSLLDSNDTNKPKTLFNVFYDINNIYTQIGTSVYGSINTYNDTFGVNISIDDLGSKLFISEYLNNGSNLDKLSCYHLSTEGWILNSTFLGESLGDKYGYDIAISSESDKIIIGAPYSDDNGNNSGKVYLLSTDEDTLTNSSIPQEQVTQEGLKIFPSPVVDYMHLSTNMTILEIEIFDLSGKLLRTESDITNIEVSNLASGVYFVNVKTNSNQVITKIIKE